MNVKTAAESPVVFELFENALLAFIFAGLLWNIAAGYAFVSASAVPAGIVLTTILLFAFFTFDTMSRSTLIDERY